MICTFQEEKPPLSQVYNSALLHCSYSQVKHFCTTLNSEALKVVLGGQLTFQNMKALRTSNDVGKNTKANNRTPHLQGGSSENIHSEWQIDPTSDKKKGSNKRRSCEMRKGKKWKRKHPKKQKSATSMKEHPSSPGQHFELQLLWNSCGHLTYETKTSAMKVEIFYALHIPSLISILGRTKLPRRVFAQWRVSFVPRKAAPLLPCRCPH